MEHREKGIEAKKEVGKNWFSFGGEVEGMKHIDPLLSLSDPLPPSKSLRNQRNANSDLLYIYTRSLSSLIFDFFFNSTCLLFYCYYYYYYYDYYYYFFIIIYYNR